MKGTKELVERGAVKEIEQVSDRESAPNND